MVHGHQTREEVKACETLLRALERLYSGITSTNTKWCDWYEGIQFDAFDELLDELGFDRDIIAGWEITA